uniref:Uncharacterized protein n=1 Tax=Anguilla anguilla TaxID=7936 RepID=A0A0E9U9H0_ANGAN
MVEFSLEFQEFHYFRDVVFHRCFGIGFAYCWLNLVAMMEYNFFGGERIFL